MTNKTNKNKNKNEKQQVVSSTFSFDNIEKANAVFDTNEQINLLLNYTSIRFKVHNDYIELFHKLRMKYAEKNKVYSFSYNEMFQVCVNFMYNDFKNKNILEKCPLDFKNAMIKTGRRKKTSRTFPNNQCSNLVVKIPVLTADKYLNIMYSFIVNNPNDNLFSDHHSRTYFFYDFVDFLNNNKLEFFKFKL